MKIFKVLPLAAVALSLGFASCSSERNTELQQGEAALSLTTTIQDQSRVTTQEDGKTNHWNAGDAISVFSTSLNAANVKYTADAEGATTSFVGGTIMIPFTTDSYTLQAYYPYSAQATATSVAYDLVVDNKQPVLWAQGTVTNAAPNLALNFAHKLGKLRIVVKDATVPTAVTTVTDASVKVLDVLSKGALNVTNGVFTPAADKADLTLRAQNNEYYTYLMPTQLLTDLVVKIEYNGKVYNAKLTSTKSVEAGKYYLYTVTLGSGEKPVVIGGDGNNTIGNEESGEEGNIDVAPEQGGGTTPPAVDPVTATVTGDNFASGVLSATAEAASYILTLDAVDPATTAVTAKVAEDWVTAVTGDNVSLTRATTRTITFAVAKNETTAERSVDVTLTAEGMNPYTFTITQAAGAGTGEGETPVMSDGDGTEATPFTVDQAVANNTGTDIWVQGYILGGTKNGSTVAASGTAILLGNAKTFEKSTIVMPVMLPDNAVRTALNTDGNPTNVGKAVKVRGDLMAYFSKPGMKNTDRYAWL